MKSRELEIIEDYIDSTHDAGKLEYLKTYIEIRISYIQNEDYPKWGENETEK